MKRLIFCLIALTQSLHAQVQQDVDILKKSYQIQDLVTLASTGSVLLPLKINGQDTHFIINSSYKGMLLDDKFAKTAKVTGNPTTRSVDADLNLEKNAKLRLGRIDTMTSGSGQAYHLMRGKQALLGATTLPVAAKFKGLTLAIGGMVGLEIVEEIEPVVDFGASKLMLPNKGIQVGLFSEVMTQNGYQPVMMVRDRRTGIYYVVIDIKRKQLAFQVDLNQKNSTIDETMCKQLAIKIKDKKVLLEEAAIGLTPINDFNFTLTKIEGAGRNMVGYRLAGKVGVDFFKQYDVAIDFAGPLAAVPIPKN